MVTHLLYIDPGSGSYLVQVVIAGILGIAFYFKTIWSKIKSIFGARRKEKAGDNPKQND